MRKNRGDKKKSANCKARVFYASSTSSLFISCPSIQKAGASTQFPQNTRAPLQIFLFPFLTPSLIHLYRSIVTEKQLLIIIIMCQTRNTRRSSGNNLAGGTPDWISESINGGSLRHVSLHTGSNGWASPPGDVFSLRSNSYFTKQQKSPAGDYLLSPAGMDWLKSTSKLDNVLSRADNRVSHALRKSQSLKGFIFAVNLQVSYGKDHYSAVFYFGTNEPIRSGSLLDRFVNGDDRFRNERFKLVNRIVKGPWIVKKAVGNHSACLLGKAVVCNYHKGHNYLEIDVDIGSSAIANAILRIAMGCMASVTIDMGFVVEAQEEEELPERLIGAVRVCQVEMAAATVVESVHAPVVAARGSGLAKVNPCNAVDDGVGVNG